MGPLSNTNGLLLRNVPWDHPQSLYFAKEAGFGGWLGVVGGWVWVKLAKEVVSDGLPANCANPPAVGWDSPIAGWDPPIIEPKASVVVDPPWT